MADDRSLLEAIYGELKVAARQLMRSERNGHTLQATALVHEAYLKISQDRTIPFASKAHFYVTAADAMRQILIDHARTRGRVKRGGHQKRVALSVLDLAASQDPEDIAALDESLTKLDAEEPELANVVRLRFFAGLSIPETAALMGISPRTVDRDWALARAWLFREMQR